MTAKYVTFEGIDGSGKTKQLELLANHLKKQGYKVLETKELGSPHSESCIKLRELALNGLNQFDDQAIQFLLAACSTQHYQQVILPALEQYDYILADRGLESNLAYCTALGLKEFANTLFLLDSRRMRPDTVIFLDIDPETSWSRISKREKEKFENNGEDSIEAKGLEFQRAVYSSYVERSKEENYLVINCNDSTIEQVHNKILKKLSL